MSSMEKPTVPVHVALIMDGNGRWAEKKHLPRTSGHKEGLTAAKDIMGAAADLGIKYVTLYAFSTENWKRTEEEVGYLMSLISIHLRAELDFYRQKGIRVKHIGDLERLPANVRKEIIRAQEDTASFTGTTLVLAINYGGRDEIIRGIKKLALSGETDNLTENNFSSFFDVPDLPDVDLLIRTGGELRLSNFLLWHTAYAEFIFTDTLWPDYNSKEFLKNIKEFQSRKRRFGGVPC